MPTTVFHNKSPFKLLFGKVPVITHLRIFGCACFPLLKSFNITKVQAKTTKCVFLGYTSKYKGYICSHVSKKRIFISRHVIFYELSFHIQTYIKIPKKPILLPVCTILLVIMYMLSLQVTWLYHLPLVLHLNSLIITQMQHCQFLIHHIEI